LIVASVTAAIVAVTAFASPAHATPPAIPSLATAQSELNALTVAAEGSTASYSRDLFPHWIIISDSCNTRETVLRRDGSGVTVNSSCAPTSGSWFSPYDGATWHLASDVDIDHIVPLAEAWRSGANTWSTSKRQSFANDLNGPQLIPLYLRQDVDPHQVPVGSAPAVVGEVGPAGHAKHLLIPTRQSLRSQPGGAPRSSDPADDRVARLGRGFEVGLYVRQVAGRPRKLAWAVPDRRIDVFAFQVGLLHAVEELLLGDPG
jgi:hypothetical protein